MSANKVTVSPTTNTITVSSPGTVGPQGGTGAAGTNGTNGTNGYSAHVGNGAPSNSLGAVNDVYFDNQNYVLYKKTGSSAWTSQGSYATTVGNYTFSTISVAGQNNVVADSATDTLTLAAGSNVTLTTNDSTDTITVAAADTTANETITLSGDVTGSGTTGISATLANSGVSAGTYGSASLIPSITVDAKGRVTGVTTSGISSSSGGTVTSVNGSGANGITVTGGPITTSGTLAVGVNASDLRTTLNVEDGADVTDAANVASAGAVMDTDFSSNGLMKRTGAGTYTVDANTYITDIASDTTPQLGGDLQTNSNDILSAHNSTDIIADSTAHFTVTAAGGYYSIDGVQQATLKLERNKSYVFDVADYSSHPFYFQTTDNGGAYDSANVVSYQSGNTTRTVILRIPNSAPDTLYYRCSQHSGMGGSVSLRPTLATVATSGSYNDLSNQPTIPSGNQIIDWTSSGAGTIHSTNIPAIALSSIQTAASESAQLALTTQEGDVVVRTDQNRTYMKNSGTAGSMADFTQILTPTDYVSASSGGTFSGNVNFTGNVTQNNASLATTGKAIAMAMVFG